MDERHDLVVPKRDLFQVFLVKKAHTVTLNDSAFAVAHFDFSPVLIHEPVRQTGSTELCQDEWSRLYDAVQAMSLASLKPAFQVAFGTGSTLKIKHSLPVFVPCPWNVRADGRQTRLFCCI